MKSLVINIALIIIIGYILTLSFRDMLEITEKNRDNKIQRYQSQNMIIDGLLLEHPKGISMKEVNDYDMKHNTQLSEIINKENMINNTYNNEDATSATDINQSNKQYTETQGLILHEDLRQTPTTKDSLDQHISIQELNSIKTNNNLKASQIKKSYYGFLSNIPALPATVNLVLLTFLCTIVKNLANTFYEWASKKLFKTKKQDK